MPYRLEGTYFENCNCDVLCPCGATNFALPATNERCVVLMAFQIASGEIDGTDVSGRVVAILADAPGQMIEGGWRTGIYVDDGASPDQHEALAAVMRGERGGPPALVASLTGELLGVESAPIEYHEDGRVHSVTIGDGIDVEVEDFPSVNEGEAMAIDGVGHPANTRLVVAHGTRSRISGFGIEISNTGKNGHSAAFTWQA